MQFDAVIRQAFKDIRVLLVAANTLRTRHLSDERTVTCLKGLLESGLADQEVA